MSKFIPILSTKRLKPDTLREALLSELAIIDYDFITVSFIAAPVSLEETIAFTSRNAVAAFAMASTDRLHNVYCLSGETLRLAETIPGITIAGTADDALSLAKKIAADGIKKISFVCGRQRRNELPDYLRLQGVKVQEEIVYETIYSGHPVKYIYKGILFFSPSAVESFFQTNILPAGITCFCIGATTAEAAREHTDNPVLSASEPSQEQVLETVKEYFRRNKSKRNHRERTDIDNGSAGIKK